MLIFFPASMRLLASSFSAGSIFPVVAFSLRSLAGACCPTGQTRAV
jgi:hypothetical protein